MMKSNSSVVNEDVISFQWLIGYHPSSIHFTDFDHFCFESRIIGMARVNGRLKSDTNVVHDWYCFISLHQCSKRKSANAGKLHPLFFCRDPQQCLNYTHISLKLRDKRVLTKYFICLQIWIGRQTFHLTVNRLPYSFGSRMPNSSA